MKIAPILAAVILMTAQTGSAVTAQKAGRYRSWWPNGRVRTDATYRRGVLTDEYRTFYETGAPYELRHYVDGRESGLQQSWTAGGELYLNYEVRGGRRYGMVNAKPCLPVSELPVYDGADFTPRWTAGAADSSASRVAGLRFSLVSQTGRAFTEADLAGGIHIASFMFTRCPAICPAVVNNLKRAQAAVADADVRLVSYSVTPDVDSPDRLAAFGRERGIDPERWRLVTGDRATIYRLARSFYFADDSRVDAPGDFLHSEKVLLVDPLGRLRGVYNGTLAYEIDKLIDDVRILRDEMRGAGIIARAR